MTKRLTRMGLLTALALILFTVEAQIPVPIPIPGMKLGLSNIITVYAMFCLSPLDTLGILLCRVILGSLLSGNLMTLLYSLSGGTACYLLMLIMRRHVTKKQIWVCSILGALAHNLGQMLCAAAVAKTPELFIYLPILLICGLFAGLFTGLCAQLVIRRLENVLHE